MNEIAQHLGNEIAKEGSCGIVIFYKPDYSNKTIKEIRRTGILPIWDAINVYSETPNPASQLIKFNTEDEMKTELEQHAKDIVDPKWLEDLFECI